MTAPIRMTTPARMFAVAAIAALGLAGCSDSSGAAPTITVTATETVTAEAAQPEESHSGPIEGEPASNADGGAFKLGEPYPLEDGSTITISGPEPITVEDSTDGMDSHYKFLVSYTNNTAEPWNPFNLTVQGTTGTTEASTFFSGNNGCSLMTTDVLPGKTLEWPVCIGANKADGLALQWSVTFGGEGWTDVELP